jgi:hypothetical protein
MHVTTSPYRPISSAIQSPSFSFSFSFFLLKNSIRDALSIFCVGLIFAYITENIMIFYVLIVKAIKYIIHITERRIKLFIKKTLYFCIFKRLHFYANINMR